MTSRTDPLGVELTELAAQRIKAGEWPWSFFCWPEDRPRPVFPSAFRLLTESGPGDRVGVAVRCPVCGRVSVNLVSREHVDLPFHNDREIGVVGHVFADDAAATIDAFTATHPTGESSPTALPGAVGALTVFLSPPRGEKGEASWSRETSTDPPRHLTMPPAAHAPA